MHGITFQEYLHRTMNFFYFFYCIEAPLKPYTMITTVYLFIHIFKNHHVLPFPVMGIFLISFLNIFFYISQGVTVVKKESRAKCF